MDVREFEPRDRAACLRIFESNTPRFVAPDDRVKYEQFLDDPPGPYLVVERDRRVAGCGGWAVDSSGVEAVLTWGMVAAPLHRHGIGRFLLQQRLERIRAIPDVELAIVRTSQLVTRFYERDGFRTVRVVRDGFGAGLDLVEMHLPLVTRV